MAQSVFARSGLAALSDIASQDWSSIWQILESVQNEFSSLEERFRSPGYPWPRDPLHNWSRVWEYPYAYHHLRAELAGGDRRMVVADVGCGVTFFPFAVARLGYRVVCVDADIRFGPDIQRAARLIDASPGIVEFRSTDGARLPFEDGELDSAYCISVLEHVPDPPKLALELGRVLAANAPLLVTIDLDLRGDCEIGVAGRAALRDAVERSFRWHAPERTVHPRDLLTSVTGPYPLKESGSLLSSTDLRRLLRTGRLAAPVPLLAVEGWALRRTPGS